MGISRPVLAGRAGISDAHLRHIELGSRNASPEVIKRIQSELVLDDLSAIVLPDAPVAS